MNEVLDLLPESIAESINRTRNSVLDLVANDQGKFRVLWVDKFDNSHGVSAEFDSPEEALAHAFEQTKDASSWSSDPSIATVYYAYSPEGKYMGG